MAFVNRLSKSVDCNEGVHWKPGNMAVKEKSESVSDEIEWNVDTELQLFYAMHGHKPVGVNKYFQMACIVEKFRNSINKDVSSQVIWDHLDTMYDMQALDDTENLPFPNDEKEFSLPAAEYASLMEEKRRGREHGENNVGDSERKHAIVKSVKEHVDKKDGGSKDVKENFVKKEYKDVNKEIKKEVKESKEPKKIVNKDVKEVRRDSKDSKEVKREYKKDGRETPIHKDIKKDMDKDQKFPKVRSLFKEKKEYKKEDDIDDISLASLTPSKKDRVKELSDMKSDDSPKRSGKRPTRGSLKPDDTHSNKSSSPVTTATPPPVKRRRT